MNKIGLGEKKQLTGSSTEFLSRLKQFAEVKESDAGSGLGWDGEHVDAVERVSVTSGSE